MITYSLSDSFLSRCFPHLIDLYLHHCYYRYSITIDDFAFEDSKSIKSIFIPSSVKDIGDQVFVGCSSITEFCVDKSNKSYRSIDGNLYSKDASEFICYAYGKEDASITLPNGVERIRNVAFKNCKKLENVDIPETVSFIDVAAFRGCSNLKRIAIPRGVKYLDRWTFEGCTSLEEVTFFEGFTSIGEGVFAGCSELKDIVIPDSVEYIDYDSFDGCDQLVIHASVGSYAEEHAKEYEIPFVAIK